MEGFPKVDTRDYDTSKHYALGKEVVVYRGCFTPKQDYPTLPTAGIVIRLPAPSDEVLCLDPLGLLLVDSNWKDGAYWGYRLSFDICQALKDKRKAKVLIVSSETLAIIKTQLSHAFLPATSKDATCAGMLYGLKVYESDDYAGEFEIY